METKLVFCRISVKRKILGFKCNHIHLYKEVGVQGVSRLFMLLRCQFSKEFKHMWNMKYMSCLSGFRDAVESFEAHRATGASCCTESWRNWVRTELFSNTRAFSPSITDKAHSLDHRESVPVIPLCFGPHRF